MPQLPQRIVSLVPSTTESVVALGAGHRLVGCTRYCVEPATALANVPRIGGTKNPRREAIMALAPDLVLANAEENRAEDLEWLLARVPLLVQTPTTVAAAVAGWRELAQVLGEPAAAISFELRLEEALFAAAQLRQERAEAPVFYAIWPKPWMSINQDTFVHDVLRVLGWRNVCAAAAVRYPIVEPAAVAAQTPAVVLLPDEPWVFTAQEAAQHQQHQTFGGARVVVCSGRHFCWHGTALAEGLARAVQLRRQLG
jgi:iron complex transport system substrate-binding protein